MSLTPGRRKLVLLAVASFLSVLVVLPSFWAFRQAEAAAAARSQSHEVILRAEALLAALTDAETGQRGYLLTGDEAFLAPYLAVRDTIRGELADVRRRSSLRAAQAHLDVLAATVDAKLAGLSQVIELRRAGNASAASALVAGGEGRRLMDSLRAGIATFVRLEEAALAEQNALFQSRMRYLFVLISVAAVGTLLFALTFTYLISREAEHRVKALVHGETRHLLAVQERTTRELQGANATLQVSEARLAVTLDSIGDAVIATDASGRVTLMNPVAENLTGWSREDAVSHRVDELIRVVDRDSREPSPFPVAETLAQGTVHCLAGPAVLLSQDGSERAIADSCAPIKGGDGGVVGAVLVFRDVTRENAAQQALRDSSERIKTILDTVGDGIVTLLARGGIVQSANSAALRMFGYAAPELVGQPFSRLVPALHGDEGEGSVEHYSASDEARAVGLGREVVGRRRDGSAFPLEIAVSQMSPGGIRCFTLVLRDISARRRSEEAERRAGALQSAIFNSANFSSIATDAKGVIQIFNVGAERMLGYAAADVTNRITPAEISDPQEVIARAQTLSSELGTPITPGFEALVFKASRGIEDIYELTYIRKDGSRLPAVVSVTALRDAHEAIIGYLLIGTDNTARKQIEAERELLGQRLREHQFYTRSWFESNIDALMTSDPSGIVTDVNTQMEALTGCTRDELIGAPFRSHFTDPERARACLDLVLRQRKVSDYELTARSRDGKETPVSFNATTFYDRDRRMQGVFGSARDVTESKRLNEVLLERNRALERARAMADKANLAKSEFLSSMSHELRSPLNAILGFAQLMDSDSNPPTAHQHESIAQILGAGWHLLTLIDDILDLAKVESGKVHLSREPVSLAEVLLECRGMVETQVQQRGIRLTFPLFDRPCFVMADRTRAKQVLMNLLSNAVKYNGPLGEVGVTVVEAAAGRTRVSVRDTGAGLTPEQVAQLFQAFNRLGQEVGGEEGTGIGLVVAKRLVELMGGSIGAESTVGVGSTFWFELVTAAAPILAVEGAEGVAFSGSPAREGTRLRTLLCVEDNPANLRLVEQVIARRPGIRLLTAVNGRSGIEIARASLPDVVLMDINLPDLNGFEVLKVLRADPVTGGIPLVALSANAMPQDVEMGLKAGFFRYITKPIRIGEFMETLDLALEFAERSPAREAELVRSP